MSSGSAEIDGGEIKFTFALWQVATVLVSMGMFTGIVWLSVRDLTSTVQLQGQNTRDNTVAVDNLEAAVVDLRMTAYAIKSNQETALRSMLTLTDEDRRLQIQIDRLEGHNPKTYTEDGP